jgi:hypothetical protein
MRLGIFSRTKAQEAPARAGLTVIGVRHHSPACARLVADTIRRLKPAYVLIEGPADFNPYLGDLRLEHQLPVALFSFHAKGDRSRASYSPFCDYSPEWQALQTAWTIGAEPLFCDLPAWHPEFGDRTNRYADPHGRRANAAEAILSRRLGEEGRDALWDALAEMAEPDELGPRLEGYFDLLRPEGGEDPTEAARENFMARYAAWAVRAAGNRAVVLVCGGWHAESIRRLALEADGVRPETPTPSEDERAGSYVVPYDYGRLDRFTGYASGMPSPGYYEVVATKGLGPAADWAMGTITRALRDAGQVVSTADRIVWQSHAEALAMTRGHTQVLRADLLDSALASLIKDGLEQPSNWAESGAIAQGTHPAVVAMLKAMSGTRAGKLAPGTRQPSLVPDVMERLKATDLLPGRSWRRVDLDWSRKEDREKAHLLHGMMLLGLPGLERVEGPQSPDTRTPRESFRIVEHADFQGRLIEASRWGGTLSMAAGAILADRVAQAPDDLAVLARALAEGLFAGLLGLDTTLGQRLATGFAQSHDIGEIGKAGLSMVRLYRFGDVFGPAARTGLGTVLVGFFDRVAWLIEGMRNSEEGRAAVIAILAARDLVRDCPDLPLEREAFLATLGRCLADPDCAPALAGAALGCRIACGEDGLGQAITSIRHFSRPEQLGDFLSGLFALSREEIAGASEVVGGVRALVDDWANDEFLIALPSMRQAFSWFPPRERERLARTILSAHGLSDASAEIAAMNWMRQRVSLADQGAAMALEAQVLARLERAGLA